MKTFNYLLIMEICLCCSLKGFAVQSVFDSVKKTKPNIIFILTDDQRFDALGFAGNQFAHTPEMDKLAKAGTYFSHAMVTTPICAASRASILTGVYERSHRYDFGNERIRQEYMRETYPEILKNNGYYTGFYGKYGVKHNNLQEQFDSYESYDRNGNFSDERGYFYKTLEKDTVHLTRYTGQKAVDFIADADINNPFCLSLSFSAPHAHDSAELQYFWQAESDKLLSSVEIPKAELGEDRFFNSLPEIVRDGFNRLRWTWRYDTAEKYQHSLKGYYRMIAGIDREIGKIREALRLKGLEENTVIIIMGDNGYFLGERQLAGKWLLYDNSVRVPLIIYDPRNTTHRRSDALALNIDIPATILDIAGLKRPDSWQGKSLVPIIQDQGSSFKRDTVLLEHLWEFNDIPPSEGLRTREWKYFRYVNNKSIEELYFLKDDPKEINNLAKNPKFAGKLEQFRKSCDALTLSFSDKYSKGPEALSVTFITSTGQKNKATYNWKGPKHGSSQTSYQLLVASTEENLKNNIGDVWDSGRVASETNKGVVHKGSSLTSKRYYWKVRIWDAHKRLSQYSENHSFEMGG